MQFEWDEDKRHENWKKHRVDFARAALIFAGDHITRIDDSEDYGEERWVSLGMAYGECFVVVHTDRDEAIRIISARKGGKHEREVYYARFLGGASGPERKR